MQRKEDFIEEAIHPQKEDPGYIDHSTAIANKPKKLSWWKRLWNWIKSLFG